MHSFFRTLCSLSFFLLALTGCTAMTPLGNPEAPYNLPRQPEVGDILHLPTGTYLTQDQLDSLVTDSRIIYVGETHDNLSSHRWQLNILRALADAYPGEIALGMEMFTPEQQEALNHWTEGGVSEKDFLKEAEWQKVWRMDFAYYRELMEFARDRKIPVLGLNAPKDLVKAIGMTKPEDLSDEQKKRLPELDLNDPYQSALVEAIYGGHDSGSAMLDGFHRVQTLWDESMAENIVNYLTSPAGANKRMVVVAGGNHVRNGFGIPRRVFRRLPTSYLLVGTKELTIPKNRQDRVMNVHVPSFPMPAYDIVIFTDYEDLPDKVKLGVILEEEDGVVTVTKVIPGSTAEETGIQDGDQIIAIDGESVKEMFDLIYAIQQKSVGDSAQLKIVRDGESFEKTVIFKPLPDGDPHK